MQQIVPILFIYRYCFITSMIAIKHKINIGTIIFGMLVHYIKNKKNIIINNDKQIKK